MTKKTTPKTCRLIAYRRVSTDKQGLRGLGMDAQDAAIAAYVASSGCELVATYDEVESGRKNNRPQLLLAIAHAKRIHATLVIAKVDRLGRKLSLVATLMESKVKFVCCDMPQANDLTIHIIAAVAEDEAKSIASRTKAGLDALKRRGFYSEKQKRVVTLGQPANLKESDREKGRALGAAAARAAKEEHYAQFAPMIRDLKAAGLSLYAIAKKLNEDGEETRNGKAWNPMQVRRILLSTA